MDVVRLLDQAGVELEKIIAVIHAIPHPCGRSETETQTAALLAVLDDEISLLSDTIDAITDKITKGTQSA